MKKFVDPQVDVQTITVEDVITTSNECPQESERG